MQVLKTLARRLQGEGVSRPRAFLTAGAVGIGVAVVAYRLLRSGSGDGDGSLESADLPPGG